MDNRENNLTTAIYYLKREMARGGKMDKKQNELLQQVKDLKKENEYLKAKCSRLESDKKEMEQKFKLEKIRL